MENNNGAGYLRFITMIATSMAAMFFLMYSHSYQILEHAWFSETRLFMTLIMGGAMMIIMLSYMLHMYKNRTANAGIFIGGIMILSLGIWLVRSQTTVNDSDYMKGMIPHHSIAILTSERSAIEDLRVKNLAEEIIEAQRKEIQEMEWLIEDIRRNGLAVTLEDAESRSVPDFESTSEQ